MITIEIDKAKTHDITVLVVDDEELGVVALWMFGKPKQSEMIEYVNAFYEEAKIIKVTYI